MRKIRTLIVDDSTVIRRLLSDSLSTAAEIEVVGTAPNGKIALAKIPQLSPDIITLDIEMPEMDGLSTVVEVRKTYPTLPIIMFSTLTQRGAESTLEALARGANDYVTKPANVGSVTEAVQSVKNELIPKIKSLCKWKVDFPSNSLAARTSSRSLNHRSLELSTARKKAQSIECIAIGSSTGGPNALMTVLKPLPPNFPVPILVVQHMPPIFTKHLANRLDQNCQLEVIEAQSGTVVRPGMVAIAPGDFHMTVKRKGLGIQILTNKDMPENSCRPAVDVLFRSVSDTYRAASVAVVLTGMGQDGRRGSSQIHEAGGYVIAQDEESSIVWGMPRAVAESGCADEILSLDDISGHLERLVANR